MWSDSGVVQENQDVGRGLTKEQNGLKQMEATWEYCSKTLKRETY